MQNFYKIEKSNEFFDIRRSENLFTMLKLNRTKYSEIFQYNHAILAELATGGYDFYLPSTTYDMSLHECTVVDRTLTLVASNISEYLAYKDIFAFKKDCVWKFLLLHNFELELELEDDISCSLDKRLSELPGIKVGEDTAASFKAGFETLYNSSCYHDKVHLAIFSVDKDYLIYAKEYEVPLDHSNIEITCLGTATMLSGGNGRFFKAKNDLGEYWYSNQYSDGYIYGSIEPINDNEYPSIYPNKDFYGYWKKDSQGFILGLTFLSKFKTVEFSLQLRFPVKELRFMKQFAETNVYGNVKGTAEFWEIITKDEKRFLMFVSRYSNHYLLMEPEDLLAN